jgi:hypothetical protein
MARPKPELILSADERDKLTTWANRPKSSPRLALRARIVLACVDETSNTAVAARLGVCGATVGTWRNRFVAKRLDGLVDDPRPGAPRTVTDADVERVVKVLYWDADGYALWSKRLERGTVKLPIVDPDRTPGPYRVEMTADDLGLVLRGIDPAEVRRQPRYRKPLA